MKGKTAILVDTGKFEIQERDVTCAEDEVLVKVEVCGLCNWEKGFFTGALPRGAEMTLGHEWAGTVVQAGANVAQISVGDKVTVLPDQLEGFAQYAAVKGNNCFKVADSVNIKDAFIEPLKCVVTVIRAVQPQAGDFGVVLGCGPMGLWVIQALRGGLLSGLIAIDIEEEKLALADKYGATHRINSKKEDINETVKEITGGHMCDFVVEGTGLPAMIEAGSRLLKQGRGRLGLMSYYEEPVEKLDFRPIADRGVEIYNPQPVYSENGLEDARRAVQLLNRGTFRQEDIITHRFPLERIQEAFETMAKKPKGYIKGVILPNG